MVLAGVDAAEEAGGGDTGALNGGSTGGGATGGGDAAAGGGGAAGALMIELSVGPSGAAGGAEGGGINDFAMRIAETTPRLTNSTASTASRTRFCLSSRLGSGNSDRRSAIRCVRPWMLSKLTRSALFMDRIALLAAAAWGSSMKNSAFVPVNAEKMRELSGIPSAEASAARNAACDIGCARAAENNKTVWLTTPPVGGSARAFDTVTLRPSKEKVVDSVRVDRALVCDTGKDAEGVGFGPMESLREGVSE